METAVLLQCLFIFVARVVDVTLGTMRTVSVLSGRRGLAWVIGLIEATVWVTAVAKVINDLSEPAYMIAYALGFATGSYVGTWVESKVALGEQIVRIFTRRADEISALLRPQGFRITKFAGEGLNSPVSMLFIATKRRQSKEIVEKAKDADPECYYIIDDMRMSSAKPVTGFMATGWRGLLNRK